MTASIERTEPQPQKNNGNASAASPNNGHRGPKSPEIEKIDKEIEEERKKRFAIINNIRPNRNRLAYKLAEKAAISKLAEASKGSTKEIGFLRRRKEQIEFRIATEAFTLEAEKDLIRKKNQIDEELEKAVKSYRLRRKLEFIEKDIEEATKKLAEYQEQLKLSDRRLDELYDNLRKHLGERREKQRHERYEKHGKHERKQDPQQPVEISFADIAIIKKRNGREEEQDGA